MVKFEERDVFMSYTYQQDIRDRMQKDFIDVPQLFVDGQYVGVSTRCHWHNHAHNYEELCQNSLNAMPAN